MDKEPIKQPIPDWQPEIFKTKLRIYYILERIADKYPDYIIEKYREGLTPFCYAVKLTYPEAVVPVRFIVEIYPYKRKEGISDIRIINRGLSINPHQIKHLLEKLIKMEQESQARPAPDPIPHLTGDEPKKTIEIPHVVTNDVTSEPESWFQKLKRWLFG